MDVPNGHTLIGMVVATASAGVLKADGTPRTEEENAALLAEIEGAKS